jgi:negative regulator of replication initiation
MSGAESMSDILDRLWKAYQLGQGSADHTARQVFDEVVGQVTSELEQARAIVEAAREVRLVSLGPDADEAQIRAFGRLQDLLAKTHSTTTDYQNSGSEGKAQRSNKCHRADCPDPGDDTVCGVCGLYCQRDWS